MVKSDDVDPTGKTLTGEGVTTVISNGAGAFEIMFNGAKTNIKSPNKEALAALAEAMRLGWESLVLQQGS